MVPTKSESDWVHFTIGWWLCLLLFVCLAAGCLAFGCCLLSAVWVGLAGWRYSHYISPAYM